MQCYTLYAPDWLNADISLPASKSISNRVLIMHALAHGSNLPSNLSDCDDTRVMMQALNEKPETIDIMAAGTAMRFLTAYLCVTPGTHVITGTSRMQQRPIRILVDALRELGAHIEYTSNEGFPPLRITGTELTGGTVILDGGVSSQYISALLMIGPLLPEGLRLLLTGDIISRPYIDMTLQLMHEFGIEAGWTSGNCIVVEHGSYTDTHFNVESDWSAASYWYEMAALYGIKKTISGIRTAPQVNLYGLFKHSYQGDSRGAELFAHLGVNTYFTPQRISLTLGEKHAEYLDANFEDIPDLAQTFAVTCCLTGTPFRFTGLQSLKIKETDRMTALIRELHKLGFVLHSEQNSILKWDGKRCEPEAFPIIDTYKDHRMAMAFAPACLVLPYIRIADPLVVSKSYPRFWEDLRSSGFLIKEV